MQSKESIISELKKTFKPIEPNKKFTVQPFQPEDALGVIKCCYAIYGEAYPIDTYYIPEKLIEENKNGNIYSIVAKTNDGEIIGHGALYRSSPPFKDLYEAGQYIILPQYRGSRAAFQINNMIATYAKEIGISGLYAEAVTNHLITQKFANRTGAIDTAIEIDLMPAEAYESDDSVTGRVSTVLQFIIFNDKPHNIFLPEIYLNKVEEFTKTLKLDRKINTTKKGSGNKNNSETSAQYFDFAGVGRLQVSEIGNDFEIVFNNFEKEIEKRKYNIAQIFVTVTQENCEDIFKLLNLSGYFFAGYLPRWMDTDAILLQKVIHTPTFEGINLYTEDSKKLFEFIKNDWKRLTKD